MNNIKPQKVYRVVNAEDELPTGKIEKENVFALQGDIPFLATKIVDNKLRNTAFYESRERKATHWLKEQELYCFTAEELERLLKDAYATGVLSAQSNETNYFQSPNDYLTSLNIK